MSSSRSKAATVSLTVGALAGSAALLFLLQRWIKQRKNNSSSNDSTIASPFIASTLPPLPMDEHSIPLPSSYRSEMDYSRFDIFVLFPSTVEAEREKHYAVMKAEHHPGADNLLLEPQDAQKKACTYGLDDSEMELIPNLQLLQPKSIQFLHVSLDSYKELFKGWSQEKIDSTLILNLCDGTELDGIPGISVLRHLQAAGVAFTGADEAFFSVSTYKIQMKRLFQKRGVATAVWREIAKEEMKEWKMWREKEEAMKKESGKEETAAAPAAASSSSSDSAAAPLSDRPAHALTARPSPFESEFSPLLSSAMQALKELPYPLLVKPDDSYCSCGITTKSVCWDGASVLDYSRTIEGQFTSIFMEEFIRGREFTVFVAGDARPTARGGPRDFAEDLSTMNLKELLAGSMEPASPSPSSASSASFPSFPSSTSSTSSSSSSSSSSSASPFPIPTTGLRVFLPIERRFDATLPFYEQFISYELFWDIARAQPGKDEFIFQRIEKGETIPIKPVDIRAKDGSQCAQQAVQRNLVEALSEEALRAYISVGGVGYSRVDLRYDSLKLKLAVLEVNANCGITQYKQTAMGEILRESQRGFHQVLDGFFRDARSRRERNKDKGGKGSA